MKIFILTILSLIAPALVGQSIDRHANQITVNGSVELKEVADQASISFTVKGVGATLRVAVRNASEKTGELVDKLLALGLKTRDISTSSFFGGENIGDKKFLSSSRDYQATLVTSVKVDSLDLLQPIIFTVSEAEVQGLSEIAFTLKDELGLRRKARSQAALKAREKAEDIAKALGITIGQVTSVEELQPTQTSTPSALYRPGRGYPNPFNAVTFSEVPQIDESTGSGFFAQTIIATSQVQVTFEIR